MKLGWLVAFICLVVSSADGKADDCPDPLHECGPCWGEAEEYVLDPDITNPPTSTPMEPEPLSEGTPTANPTKAPSSGPTRVPMSAPTSDPTSAPNSAPAAGPTYAPTSGPTNAPTTGPTSTPTTGPTTAPTKSPVDTPAAPDGCPYEGDYQNVPDPTITSLFGTGGGQQGQCEGTAVLCKGDGHNEFLKWDDDDTSVFTNGGTISCNYDHPTAGSGTLTFQVNKQETEYKYKNGAYTSEVIGVSLKLIGSSPVYVKLVTIKSATQAVGFTGVGGKVFRGGIMTGPLGHQISNIGMCVDTCDSNYSCNVGNAGYNNKVGKLVASSSDGTCAPGAFLCEGASGTQGEMATSSDIQSIIDEGKAHCTIHQNGEDISITFAVTEVIRSNTIVTGIGLKLDAYSSDSDWYMLKLYMENNGIGRGFDADGKLFIGGSFGGDSSARISKISVCMRPCSDGTNDEYGCPHAWSLLQNWDLFVMNDLMAAQDVEGPVMVGGNILSQNGFQVAIHSQPTTAATFVVGGTFRSGYNSIKLKQGSMIYGPDVSVKRTNQGVFVGGRLIDFQSSISTYGSDADLVAHMASYRAQMLYFSAKFLKNLSPTGTIDIPGPGDQPRAVKIMVDTVDSYGVAVFNVDGSSLFMNSKVQQIEFVFSGSCTMDNVKFIIINVSGQSISWTQGNMVGNFFIQHRRKIIFNWYEATYLKFQQNAMGVQIAPLAQLDITTAVEGATVVGTFNGSGEIHYPLANACPFGEF